MNTREESPVPEKPGDGVVYEVASWQATAEAFGTWGRYGQSGSAQRGQRSSDAQPALLQPV